MTSECGGHMECQSSDIGVSCVCRELFVPRKDGACGLSVHSPCESDLQCGDNMSCMDLACTCNQDYSSTINGSCGKLFLYSIQFNLIENLHKKKIFSV